MLRVAVATLMALGVLTTSLAANTEAARCGDLDALGKATPVMACCQAGMAKCHMPQPTKLCGCKQPTPANRAAPATLPLLTTFEIPMAAQRIDFSPVFEEQPLGIASQCISWECDLPPPESRFGYLPNRAPPSL